MAKDLEWFEIVEKLDAHITRKFTRVIDFNDALGPTGVKLWNQLTDQATAALADELREVSNGN